MTIDESLATCPVVDRDGYAYLIHPLADGIPRVDPALLEEWTDWAAAQDLLAGATVLLAPEAMGIPLAAALSLRTGIPYLVVRKRQYDLDGEEVAYCETGYGQSCLYVNGLEPDDRVVLVDDVFSTGGTLDALLSTLAHMDVAVAGTLLFIDKGTRRAALEERHEAPIRAMRTVTVEAGRVHVTGS